MTIRRQYQLPNCSLVLDGLSIDPAPGNEQVMSLLVNAECRISGLSRSLNGGYNFFAALVRAVSQYGQEVLSGYAHPQVAEDEPLLVHINPGDGPYHHLVVQPEIADLGDAGDGRAIDIKLSSVQLFDLTEAVDQFFDDTQTLPELEQGLSPLARRFVRSEEPLSDRALPAVLGIGSLVAATMAIGLLAIPEIRDPAIDTRRPEQSEEVAASGEGDTDDDELTDPPAATEGTEAADETSEAAISELVEEAASESVGETVDEVATTAETVEGAATEAVEPVAETVTAAAGATVGDIAFDNSPPGATQSFSEVEALNQQLKRTIVDSREQPRFGEAISYRVRVDEDGNILGYQAENSQAESSIDETPLPGLVKAASSEDATAVDYRIVFTERGVVEVSPWWGWSYYN